MPETRTYASDLVLVIVGGVPMTGTAPDTFVNIEPTSDMVTSQVGADGEVARSRNSDRRATIEITLLGTSPSNDVLSGMVAADELSGSAMFPVTVQDLRGTTMFLAPQAWIRRKPNITYGGEVGTRTWTLEAGAPSIWLVGGSFT